MTAADPARCGVAIDVPWKNAQHGGVAQDECAGCELKTLTPGAIDVGLDAEVHVGRALGC